MACDEPPQLIAHLHQSQYNLEVRQLNDSQHVVPDIFNILLQVLDDGRLTDNKGRTVNFKNTIIIMTSNIGSHIIQENFDQLDEFNKEDILAKTKLEVFDVLKKTIRPEFLNRIDEVIMFEPLNREDMVDIVNIQLKDIARRLAEQHITLSATEEAIDWLAQLGYDPHYGARPVKRILQKQVLNELSKQLLADKIDKSKEIVIDVFDKKIVFRNALPEVIKQNS